MAKGKQRAWHVLDGLYRDVEDARRHHEHGTNPDGAAAFERWLEIIDIAHWALEERDPGDSPELESDDAASPDDADGPDEGRQLELPSGTRGVEPDVPRGTLREQRTSAPLVGTAPMVMGRSKRLVGGG